MTENSQQNTIESPTLQTQAANVFVGGITKMMKTEDILGYLQKFGEVQSFDMPINPETGEWKGYAKAYLPAEGLSELLSIPVHRVKGSVLGVKPWVNKKDYLLNKDEINKRKLFVKFQPYMKAEQLRTHFSQFGTIQSIELKVDPITKKQRPFCFIIFTNEDGAVKACDHGNLNDSNQKITCELTTPRYIFEKGTKETSEPKVETTASLTPPPVIKKSSQPKEFPASNPFDCIDPADLWPLLIQGGLLPPLPAEAFYPCGVYPLQAAPRAWPPRPAFRGWHLPAAGLPHHAHAYHGQYHQTPGLQAPGDEQHAARPTSLGYPARAHWLVGHNHRQRPNLKFRVSRCRS